MNKTLAVNCESITKHYRHFQLKNIDLSFEQGTIMGLVGPNGAGKSTFLRIIMGLVRPNSGSVKVMGYSMPNDQIAAKHNIGFIAEDMRLFESETIAFHMEFIKSIFDSWDDEYAATSIAPLRYYKRTKGKRLVTWAAG